MVGERQSEIALWRQVINQAIIDAVGLASGYGGRTKAQRKRWKKRLQNEAQRWFRSEDFNEVCALADVNVNAIRYVAYSLFATKFDKLPACIKDHRQRIRIHS